MILHDYWDYYERYFHFKHCYATRMKFRRRRDGDNVQDTYYVTVRDSDQNKF